MATPSLQVLACVTMLERLTSADKLVLEKLIEEKEIFEKKSPVIFAEKIHEEHRIRISSNGVTVELYTNLSDLSYSTNELILVGVSEVGPAMYIYSNGQCETSRDGELGVGVKLDMPYKVSHSHRRPGIWRQYSRYRAIYGRLP